MNKKFSDYITWKNAKKLLVTVTAIIAIIAGFYFYKFPPVLSPDQSVWGQFGDYFGGVLNPILTAITFLAVLVTIALQKEELKDQRDSDNKADIKRKNEEFEKTFFEFLRTREGVVSGTKMVISLHPNKQIEYSGREGFKSLYKSFLDFYHQELAEEFLRDILYYHTYLDKEQISQIQHWLEGQNNYWKIGHYPSKNEDRTPAYPSIWEYMEAKKTNRNSDYVSYLSKVQGHFISDVVESDLDLKKITKPINKSYGKFFQEQGFLIGLYFRNMFYHLEYLNQEGNKGYLEKDLNFYSKLYRSHLSSFEIIMLLYNCLSEHTSEEFNRNILRHEFLKDVEKQNFRHQKYVTDLISQIEEQAFPEKKDTPKNFR